MYNANLRIILDATSEAAAKRVLSRMGDHISIEVNNLKPYHKGGFEVAATMPVAGQAWSEAVYNLIHHAQKIGRGWVLTDDISEQVDLTCDDFSVAGINFVNITLSQAVS